MEAESISSATSSSEDEEVFEDPLFAVCLDLEQVMRIVILPLVGTWRACSRTQPGPDTIIRTGLYRQLLINYQNLLGTILCIVTLRKANK